MREHQRVTERIQTAQEYRQEVEARPEPFTPNSFGFTSLRPTSFPPALAPTPPLPMPCTEADWGSPLLANDSGTARAPELSHHAPTPGTLLAQYPAVSTNFSGDHSFTEDLAPLPARRRRHGPKKPIVSKKLWKCTNTPKVRAGEEFAKNTVAKAEELDLAVRTEKMARQMYMRNMMRFSMAERAFQREALETRSGTRGFQTSHSDAHQSLPRSAHGWHTSRSEVLPGDLLQSIERYSRNPGSLMHEKKSILPNGFLSRDGANEQLKSHFLVDDQQQSRETVRVVTGGAADRLNYSDGSLRALMPPKILAADPTLAAKPLVLRDGTQATIRSVRGTYAHL